MFVTLLETLRLRLHGKKSRIFKISDGVDFLGYRIFPKSRRYLLGERIETLLLDIMQRWGHRLTLITSRLDSSKVLIPNSLAAQ